MWYQASLLPLATKLPAQVGLQEVSTRMHLAASQQILASGWRSELRLKPLNMEYLKSKETTASDRENSHKSITYLQWWHNTESNSKIKPQGTLPCTELTQKTGFLQIFRPVITLPKSMRVLPLTLTGNCLLPAKLSARAWQMGKNRSLNAMK